MSYLTNQIAGINAAAQQEKERRAAILRQQLAQAAEANRQRDMLQAQEAAEGRAHARLLASEERQLERELAKEKRQRGYKSEDTAGEREYQDKAAQRAQEYAKELAKGKSEADMTLEELKAKRAKERQDKKISADEKAATVGFERAQMTATDKRNHDLVVERLKLKGASDMEAKRAADQMIRDKKDREFRAKQQAERLGAQKDIAQMNITTDMKRQEDDPRRQLAKDKLEEARAAKEKADIEKRGKAMVASPGVTLADFMNLPNQEQALRENPEYAKYVKDALADNLSKDEKTLLKTMSKIKDFEDLPRSLFDITGTDEEQLGNQIARLQEQAEAGDERAAAELAKRRRLWRLSRLLR